MFRWTMLGLMLVGCSAVLFALSSISGETGAAAPSPTDDANRKPTGPPLYRSSVTGTDYDFIRMEDHDAFEELSYSGFSDFEMPDKRSADEPLVQKAYIFTASFSDKSRIAMAFDRDFGSRQAAEQEAARYTSRLGKLPSLYRQRLKHVIVHKGGRDTTAFAEDKGRFFVIYSENAKQRLATHDLEETFFHEATHATIQTQYLGTPEWRAAVSRDGGYITEYAKTEGQEDFAESALFAYTLIHHPGRFPPAERAAIENQIPNRIGFFKNIYTGKKD